MSLTLSRRQLMVCASVLLLATALRVVWLTSDPPVVPSVGVVWHDEGAWTHNARNQALWGVWRTDEWNPMFIAPVFTAMEAAAFDTLGVGTWQARTVPVASGLIAILALMWGLSAVAGRKAALLGGILLATNYTFVMWNRAALMESTMTMFIVMAWAAYARSERRPAWGAVAGLCAVLAFFTKAAAAFFIGALVLELATRLWTSHGRARRIVATTALGLAVAAGIALVTFVVPHWSDFQFYNWAMTVTRKPDYNLNAFAVRASWLPLVHPAFTRMWLVLAVAGVATASIVLRWRSAHPGERLAVLWLMVGLLELVVHDSGNERRYVMFVPAFIALACTVCGSVRATPLLRSRLRKPVVLLTVAVAGYLLAGSLARQMWLNQIEAGHFAVAARVSAAFALAAVGAVWWRWSAWSERLSGAHLPLTAALALLVITSGTDLYLYGQWASTRTTTNYDASRMLGTLLPPGTLVHGKLANGLALENRISPLFVGRGFGNYADRLERDDARYILTYTQPRLGYEGSVILDVLQHYPQQRVIVEFDVDETPGPDRAALIDKFPDGPESRARHQ